jgi:outer membrane immunogenic protein
MFDSRNSTIKGDISMKKIALAAAAVAALSMPAAAQSGGDWSGPYGGVLIGAVAGDNTWHGINGAQGGQGGGNSLNAVSYDLDGAAFGGVIGYNLQMGNTVVGVEADIMLSNADGNGLGGVGRNDRPFSSEMNALGTVTGRFGQAMGSTLIYAEAGAAMISLDHSHTDGGGNVMTAGETRGGWVIGFGVEQQMANGWTLRGEFNHMQFNSSAVQLSGPGANSAFAIDSEVNRLTLGLVRRF